MSVLKRWNGVTYEEVGLTSDSISSTEKGAINGVATLGADGKLVPAQSGTITALGTPTTIGTDGQGTGVQTNLRFPLPALVDARYGVRHNVGSFTDAGGTYRDSLFFVGYNPDRDVATEPQFGWRFEHKFRQSGASPFDVEMGIDYNTPSGLARRPFVLSGAYDTGNVSMEFRGRLSMYDSAGSREKFRLEEGVSGPLRIQRTTVSFSRVAADTHRAWEFLVDSVDTAVLDSAGALGLGGAPDGAGKLYLKGTGDFARMFIINQTNNKTWQVGSRSGAIAGDLTIEQAGNFLRMAHTSGRVTLGNQSDDEYNDQSARLFLRQTGTDTGLAIMGSDTADIFRAIDSTRLIVHSRFNKAGYFMTRKVAAPADADLVASEMALWLDATNGAAKLMIKAKQADGTVRTGSVALV